jgi:hypothetical protein
MMRKQEKEYGARGCKEVEREKRLREDEGGGRGE